MFYIIAIIAAIFAMPRRNRSKNSLLGRGHLYHAPTPNFLWCAGSNGISVYDASGHYVVMMAARGGPKLRTLLMSMTQNAMLLHRNNTRR
jgi:hypothetical protein